MPQYTIKKFVDLSCDSIDKYKKVLETKIELTEAEYVRRFQTLFARYYAVIDRQERRKIRKKFSAGNEYYESDDNKLIPTKKHYSKAINAFKTHEQCTNNIAKFKDKEYNDEAKDLYMNYKEIIIHFNKMISNIHNILSDVRNPKNNLELIIKKDLAKYYYTSKLETRILLQGKISVSNNILLENIKEIINNSSDVEDIIKEITDVNKIKLRTKI